LVHGFSPWSLALLFWATVSQSTMEEACDGAKLLTLVSVDQSIDRVRAFCEAMASQKLHF
jgi:hypothetical protein